MDTFMENLYLKRQVKELKELVTKAGVNKLIEKHEKEVARLRSWIPSNSEIYISPQRAGKLNMKMKKLRVANQQLKAANEKLTQELAQYKKGVI
jgi:hypothetical protein